MKINISKIKKRYFGDASKMKFLFAKHATQPVVENAILFESFHGKNVSDSPLHMLQELMRQGRASQFTIYYATAEAAAHQPVVDALKLPVTLVDIMSEDYARVLATSKYLVNNSSFPAWFIRRDEQRYIQTWHGTPLKTLGKRMRLGIESMYNVQHNFTQANIITFPNSFTKEVIMRDYNLELLFCNKAAMLGYPRNDVFMREDGAAVRKRCGLEGKTCFAYMPTWRGRSNHSANIEGYAKDLDRILSDIDASLTDNQLFFVNLHSMVASQIELSGYERVRPFPAGEDSYEFLNAMDVLVTDYSSVFFDFALTHKPIILFTYDIDEYLEDRGLYLDISTMPFRQVSTTQELVDSMQSGDYAGYRYWEGEFAEYLEYDSADNAAKALDLLFDGEADGVPVEDYSRNAEREWRSFYPKKQRHVEDIRTICETADPQSEIVVFNKSTFTEDMSAFLHDNYRDAFRYMFTIYSCPRTIAEDVESQKSGKVAAKLEQRNNRRIFGPLNIVGPTRETAFTPQEGTSLIENAKTGQKLDGANTVQVAIGNVDNRLQVRLLDDGYDYRHVFFMVSGLLYGVRELTDQEARSRTVVIDLRDAAVIGNTKVGTNVRIGFSGTRKGDAADAEPLFISPIVQKSVTQNNPVFLTKPFFLELDGFSYQQRHESNYLNNMLPDEGCALLAMARQSDGALQVKLAKRDDYLRHVAKGHLRRLVVGRKGVSISAKLALETFRVVSVKLKYRSADEDIEYELPTKVRASGAGFVASTAFNPADYALKEVYWDVYLRVVNDELGIDMDVPVRCPAPIRYRMLAGNMQIELDDGNVFFPGYGRGAASLYFVYRPMCPYDTAAYRRRELAAYAAYRLLKPYWMSKNILIVHEKFCATAQDNGFYFFKYCMDELPPQEKSRIFYIMDMNAKDAANLADYEDNVLEFMSFKHLVYAQAARIDIASDSTSHLFTWRPKPSVVAHAFKRKKTFFLQHGVTALKRVDYIFGKRGTSPMAYFLTTSKSEQKIVTEHFGYTTAQAPVLGFSRWDVLEDKSDKDAPMVLIMPTWRQWLEEQTDEVFVQSEYFQRYSALIQSRELNELLARNNATAKFFIHPKLSGMLGNFDAQSSRIELVAQGSVPLNELMMQCSMLITDYSSVCWDVLYMDKPVSFYQFDKERYNNVVGSYIDFERDLPGDSCSELDELLRSVEASFERGFELADEHARRAERWYESKDNLNRKRTYDYIVEQGF